MNGCRRIGIFPDPYLKDKWNNECNQVLKYWADSIKDYGYEVVGVSLANLLKPHELTTLRIDLIHFHWPEALLEHFVSHSRHSRFSMLYLLSIKLNIRRWFKDFQLFNIPLVLQIHDLVCHQYDENRLLHDMDLYFRSHLYKISRMVMTQEYSSLSFIEQAYGKKPSAVTYLGDFQAFHGGLIDKTLARSLLNIDADKKIFLYMGTARPNRNPLHAINVFNTITDNDAVLVVAGMHTENFQKFSCAGNVLFYSGMLDNDLVRNLFCAADFLINDGTDYLTSGVLRCAMSYGLPVITCHYGASIDMTAGAAIDIKNHKDGLFEAIGTALQLGNKEYDRLVDSAKLRNSERHWSQYGEVCNSFYRDILNIK